MPRHRRALFTPDGRPTGGRGVPPTVVALSALAVTAVVVAAGIVVGFRLTSHDSPPVANEPATSLTPLPPSIPAVVAPAPSSPSVANDLQASFADLEAAVSGAVGIALTPVGASPQHQIVLGEWTSGPAWSTMKVPLAIAVLRAEDPPTVTESMTAAITRSDNAAADVLWQSLGDPQTAAAKVGDVLHAAGDPTTVQAFKTRAEFSAFGQTDWSLVDQANFLAAAACNHDDAPVFDLMGQITADQQWGLGRIPGTVFKGGWGPSESGAYLVRQIGLLTGDAGQVAVAIAVRPASGSFADGTAELTHVADWLRSHIAELPSGRCAG